MALSISNDDHDDGEGWIMVLKKGEQFALFDLDVPERAPSDVEAPEPLQPSLFDLADDEADGDSRPDTESAVAAAESKTTDAESAVAAAESKTTDADTETAEPGTSEQSERDIAAPSSLPPAGESADGHAVIVTAAGTYTPSGQVLTGPVDSVEKLARTGAAVLDKIKRERTRSGKGIVVTAAGPVPPLDGEHRGDLEPAVGWTRVPDPEEFDDATVLVSIDQRAAYLASAGMLEFGYGKPRHLRAEDAMDAAEAVKTPFGLWRVTLPAGNMLALPDKLPLPHPHMLADQPVQTWITSVSLDAFCAPVADGGIGAELDDLDITEAWVYPEQGRALDKWAKILREARKVAVDTNDAAIKRFLGACYKGYIGRMVNPDMWTAKQMQHHHQPLWRAAIIAHCRWRGRRVAMRIARETGRWPLRTVTDSWVYPLPDRIDVADDSDALGKMTLEKRAALTDDLVAALTEARDTHEINLAIKAVFADDDEGNN